MGLFLSRLKGVFDSLSSGNPARILMLGLDAAGKNCLSAFSLKVYSEASLFIIKIEVIKFILIHPYFSK